MTGSTPSQTVGPFFRFGLEWLAVPELVAPSDPAALTIAGLVLDGAGDPVPDAVVEVWQADATGGFGGAGWGRCLSGPDGSWGCTTVKPGRVDDRQAPHLAVTLFCRGILQRLVTRIYFPDEAEANATDPVLTAAGERAATLVAVPDGPRALRHDLVLQGQRETVFFVF